MGDIEELAGPAGTDLADLMRELDDSVRSHALAKARSEDLALMVENHLNPDDTVLPLPPGSLVMFGNVHHRYRRLLEQRGVRPDSGICEEYGFTASELTIHMGGKCPSLPRAMSVFDGQAKYNLMQVAMAMNGDESWKVAGDQTKHWYEHLLAQAIHDMQQKEIIVRELRAQLAAMRTTGDQVPAATAEAVKIPEKSQESAVAPLPVITRHTDKVAEPVDQAVRRGPPRRLKNAEYRDREYLDAHEIDMMMDAAARVGRHGARDAAIILLAYRHGLSVAELVGLRWADVDLQSRTVRIERGEGGSSVHGLHARELQALAGLQDAYPGMVHVFSSERDAPLTSDAIRKICGRAGREAGLPITVHPHMLRHSCGYNLAKSGHGAIEIQEYLGMRDARYALRYFEDGRTGDTGQKVKKHRGQRIRYLRLSKTKSDKR